MALKLEWGGLLDTLAITQGIMQFKIFPNTKYGLLLIKRKMLIKNSKVKAIHCIHTYWIQFTKFYISSYKLIK
jgi:hypothetical protein